MKLVLACEIYPPDIGGPATFIKRLLPVLEENNFIQHQQGAGFSPSVLTYADNLASTSLVLGLSAEAGVIKVSRKLPLPLRYAAYFFKLLKMARGADLIFAQGPTAAGLPAILVKKLLGKKVIIKVVGDVAWERSFNNGLVTDLLDDFQVKDYGFKIEWQKKLRAWTVKNADLIITPSQYLKKMVLGWGADSTKVQVIYNSFAVHSQPVDKLTVKKQLGLEGKIILSAGRLAPWKGFSALIELMPEFLKIDPAFKLIIAGSGPDQEKLEAQIVALGLAEKIKLIGQIAQAKMLSYYAAADIFILNSGYEGLSHALLEALSYSLPVLASAIGGNPEVIIDGENGLLFAYNNKEQIVEALGKISTNPELREKFSLASQKVLAKFSFAKMIAEYLTVLKAKS